MTDWRPIETFPGYLINEDGEILNEWTNHIMKPRLNHQGFLMINLMNDKTQFTRSVAILVAAAFLDDPVYPHFDSIIHLNGDREDCRAENLMWRPRWYAMRYHKMFNEEPARVGVYIADTDEVFETLREACVKYGLIEDYAYADMLNETPVFYYGWIFKRLRDNRV